MPFGALLGLLSVMSVMLGYVCVCCSSLFFFHCCLNIPPCEYATFTQLTAGGQLGASQVSAIVSEAVMNTRVHVLTSVGEILIATGPL